MDVSEAKEAMARRTVELLERYGPGPAFAACEDTFSILCDATQDNGDRVIVVDGIGSVANCALSIVVSEL